MSRYFTTTVSLLCGLACGHGVACEPSFRNAHEDSKTASRIIVGYVTGHTHSGYEKHLLGGGSPDRGQVGDVLVRVVAVEALKGDKSTEVILVQAGCIGDQPKSHARVVLLSIDDVQHLIEDPQYEEDARASLRRPL